MKGVRTWAKLPRKRTDISGCSGPLVALVLYGMREIERGAPKRCYSCCRLGPRRKSFQFSDKVHVSNGSTKGLAF